MDRIPISFHFFLVARHKYCTNNSAHNSIIFFLSKKDGKREPYNTLVMVLFVCLSLEL